MKNASKILFCAILAAGLALVSPGGLASSARAQQTPAPASASAAETIKIGDRVKVTFRNGDVREGVVTQSDDSILIVKVVIAGISSEITYQRSEIAKVERLEAAAPKGNDSKGNDSKPGPASAAAGTSSSPPASPPATPPATATAPPAPASATADDGLTHQKVFYIELKGEFGRDISVTPLKSILAEAKRAQPDVIIFKVATDFKVHGVERQDFNAADAGAAFNQLETVRELQTLFTDGIRDDPEWKTKPRLVMWVKKALGGVAFFPFVAPEIYYTSDALHGGIGALELIFEGVGDKVVQEKQYSLRLGRAEGLAIKGGYDARIIKAMTRIDYVLSYTLVGGKPVYFEDMSGDVLLTDDGDRGKQRRDTLEDEVRFRGNDVLTLNPQNALVLGVSKGTADTLDELLSELGIARTAELVKNRSASTLGEWSKNITEAEKDFARHWRDYGRITVTGATPAERNKGRGQQIGKLNDINTLLKRYKEAINPQQIQGAPEQWESRIDLMINQIKQQMRLDR